MAKASKVIISVPDDLLERIDREAKERGTSWAGPVLRKSTWRLSVATWPSPELGALSLPI